MINTIFAFLSSSHDYVNVIFWAALLPSIAYSIATAVYEFLPILFKDWAKNYQIHSPTKKIPLSEYAKIAFVVVQGVVLLFVLHAFFTPLYILRGIETSLDELPTLSVFLVQLFAFAMIFDTVFYWLHRLLHQKTLFRHIHKTHHSYREAIPIIGAYVHPLEFVTAYFLPFAIAELTLGCHVTVLGAFAIIMGLHTVHDHCGHAYPFDPIRLLSTNNASGHDFHHSKVNVNYSGGLFKFWDKLCGTEYKPKTS